MKILISTLKEELVTIKRLEQKYAKKLKELPKGSFIVRTIKGKDYGYLTHRDGESVKQKYLGRLTKEEIKLYRKAVKQKKEYKKQLRSVREQRKVVERALRGKTK